MDAKSLISAALREAGAGTDAIGSLPRIMRFLYAGDVRIEVGRNARKPGLSPPYDPLVDALGGLKPTSFSIPHIA